MVKGGQVKPVSATRVGVRGNVRTGNRIGVLIHQHINAGWTYEIDHFREGAEALITCGSARPGAYAGVHGIAAYALRPPASALDRTEVAIGWASISIRLT